MHTAHEDPEDLVERTDDEGKIEKSAKKLARLILQSKHTVIFTGAGISTDAGIPDFRGPEGCWTLAAQGRERALPTVDMMKAVPTKTHMAIVALIRAGLCKHLISQNCDGLHRKSGVDPKDISELHGNSMVEKCSYCGVEYMRDFDVCRQNPVPFVDFGHTTGRNCDLCGQQLLDTLVNFGENLPKGIMKRAYKLSGKAELHIVLGSSLTVKPASNMPVATKKAGGRLAICNLQRTPLDSQASVRCFARCDDLMERVMEHLGIAIPSFVLRRHLKISRSVVELTEDVETAHSGAEDGECGAGSNGDHEDPPFFCSLPAKESISGEKGEKNHSGDALADTTAVKERAKGKGESEEVCGKDENEFKGVRQGEVATSQNKDKEDDKDAGEARSSCPPERVELHRRRKVHRVVVEGLDADHRTPASYIRYLEVWRDSHVPQTPADTSTSAPEAAEMVCSMHALAGTGAPFSFDVPIREYEEKEDEREYSVDEESMTAAAVYRIVLHFWGHYGEPPLTLRYRIDTSGRSTSATATEGKVMLVLKYSCDRGTWKISRRD